LYNLITSFDPYPNDHQFRSDFLVGAVDGSGVSPLIRYDDVMIHLVTAAISIHNTGTQTGRIMETVPIVDCPPLPDRGRTFEAFWFSLEEDTAWNYLETFVKKVYGVEDLNKLMFPYFSDYFSEKITSISKLMNLGITKAKNIKNLVIYSHFTDTQQIHDAARTILELSLAKKAIDSPLKLKYLFLDSSLTLLIRRDLDYPTPLEDYILRDLCYNARKRGVTILAVSKHHTVPYTSLIAEMAKEKFGNAHWFCRIPSGLKILQGKRLIPPRLAVTYLFQFTSDSPVLRLDLDEKWWEKNIRRDDPEEMRNQEIKLFRDIDFFSHDARWFGYPAPLAFAHNECKITGRIKSILVEEAINVAREEGFDGEKLRDARFRIGLEGPIY